MKIHIAWPVLLLASICFGQVESGKAANKQPPAERQAAPPVVSDEAGVLSTRPVWPVNVPLYVTVNRGRFFDAKPHDLTLSAELPSAPVIKEHVIQSGLTVDPEPDMTWRDWKYLAGTPVASAAGVKFSLNVADPQGQDPKGPARPKAPIMLPVQVKGTLDEILTGTPLPDLDAALRKELNATLYRRGWNSNGSPRLWLGTYTNCDGKTGTEYPGICHVLAKHPDVTLAVRVEVLHDGKLVAKASAWWRGVARYKSVEPFEGMLAPEVLDNDFDNLDPKDGKWALHFVPAPEVALRDFESIRYWKGDASAPVKVTDSRDWAELKANGDDK